MCGINGFNFIDTDLIKKMLAITSSRGPDYEEYIEKDDFTIGHNRLSIIDPNPRSNQPYVYKHYILSFNGEIYNYRKLRKDLITQGYGFETESDTEVIIKLFDKKGTDAFRELSGIFSISIYDSKKKKIVFS